MPRCYGAKSSEGGQQVAGFLDGPDLTGFFPALFLILVSSAGPGGSAGSGTDGLSAVLTIHCSLLTSPNQTGD